MRFGTRHALGEREYVELLTLRGEEIRRLREELAQVTDQRDQARAEVEALRAELARVPLHLVRREGQP